MGRAPCCDKANVKKGPWSPEEDATLKSYIEKHGTGGNWIALPQKIGLKRCGKSCRLRWLNYLRPNIKHGGFSEEEDNIICTLYTSIGSRWSIIAAQLPGRTDNDIKNYWNTRLKKKLLGKQRKQQQAQNRRAATTLKQEMMKRSEGENFASHPTGFTNQNPYVWNTCLPMNALPNYQTHDGLVKDTMDTSFMYPIDISSSSSSDQFYHHHFQTPHYDANNNVTTGGSSSSPTMLQGLDDPQLSEVVAYGNIFGQQNQQLADGFYYQSDEAVKDGSRGTSTITSAESDQMSWGDINSLVYSTQMVSDYDNITCQPQHSVFAEPAYFGLK